MKIDVGALKYQEIKDALIGTPVDVIGFLRVNERVVLEVRGT